MLERARSLILSMLPDDSTKAFTDIEGHVTSGLLRRGDQALIAMWRVEGRLFETLEDGEIYARRSAVNSLLVNRESPRLVFGVHDVRSFADPSVYPTGTYRSSFSRDLDEAYRAQLIGPDARAPLYANETYWSLVLRPFVPLGELAQGWLKKARAVREEPLDEGIQIIEEVISNFEAAMRPYGLKRLRTREENGVVFSEIAEAIVMILYNHHLAIPIPDGPLGEALYTDRVRFGLRAGMLQFDLPGRERYATVIGFKRPPNPCPPGLFDRLRAAPFDYSFSRFFHFLTNAEADQRFSAQHNRMMTANDPAKSQMVELGRARNRLMARDFVVGNHMAVMTVFADNERAMEMVAAEAVPQLAQHGAQAAREGLSDMAAWWSHIPGNLRFWPRPMPINSLNFAAMTLPHSYPTGPEKARWGDPLTVYRSSGGTLIRFHLHVRDVGNTAVFGPTGAGKTTWALHLFAQAEKSGARVVFYDQFRGADLGIRALGGAYNVLQDGVPTGFNPLRALTDRPRDTAYLREMLAGMVLSDGGRRLDTEEIRAIGLAVRMVMELPRQHRSLAEVRAFLGHGHEGPGERLEPWINGNEFGWALDCPEDRASFDGMVSGYDTTGLATNKRARGAIQAYLAHRTQGILGTGRVIVAIDEFHAWIEDDYWAKFAVSLARTIRRRNGALIMLTQHPGDITRSQFGHTLMQQTRQWLFFGDPTATPEDYVDKIQISKRMFEIIKRRLSPNAGEFLLVRDGEAQICQLPLMGMDDLLMLLSSRDQAVALAETIRSEHGEKSEKWIPELIKRKEEVTA